MRLLHTNTLVLETQIQETNLEYAILSHRWEEDEVTYFDMQNITTARKKAGFKKIERCCEVAKSNGYDYVWIDTCCIDKSSSAELTEAINSMYRWYQNAVICYAFLSDVEGKDEDQFRESKWFTRGWTLQELLAPARLLFLDSSWSDIGSRDDLASLISPFTRIPVSALLGENILHFSIADRMSWAASRTTTRVEDIAYSLLGIFNVHMPMLYGEGKNAFFRLQEEIIKHSYDHSIFAWTGVPVSGSGLFAPSPSYFSTSASIDPNGVSLASNRKRESYSVTNTGLSIALIITPCAFDTYLAFLECSRRSAHRKAVAILLKRSSSDGEGFLRVPSPAGDRKDLIFLSGDDDDKNEFIRVAASKKRFSRLSIRQDSVASYVPRSMTSQKNSETFSYPGPLLYGVQIIMPDEMLKERCKIMKGDFNKENGIAMMKKGEQAMIVGLRVRYTTMSYDVQMNIGFDFDFRLCFMFANELVIRDNYTRGKLFGRNAGDSKYETFEDVNFLDERDYFEINKDAGEGFREAAVVASTNRDQTYSIAIERNVENAKFQMEFFKGAGMSHYVKIHSRIDRSQSPPRWVVQLVL